MWRTTTLTQSNAPISKSAMNEIVNEVEKPNTIVAVPKPATDHSNVWPALAIGRRCIRASDIPKRRTIGPTDPAVGVRAHGQDVLGIHGQQGRRAAEQHGKHVERHGA